MKLPKIELSNFIIAGLFFWGLSLLLLAIPALTDNHQLVYAILPITMLIAVLWTFAAAAFIILGPPSKGKESESRAHKVLAQIIAGLILATLIISTLSAIRSFWYRPGDGDYEFRFVYENIANGVGLASIALVFILSTMQKHAYWAAYKIRQITDRMILQRRHEVLETSYLVATPIVLLAAFWLSDHLWLLPAIIANNHGSVPGHIYWIGGNLALLLFALPLIIAAWKRKS